MLTHIIVLVICGHYHIKIYFLSIFLRIFTKRECDIIFSSSQFFRPNISIFCITIFPGPLKASELLIKSRCIRDKKSEATVNIFFEIHRPAGCFKMIRNRTPHCSGLYIHKVFNFANGLFVLNSGNSS